MPFPSRQGDASVPTPHIRLSRPYGYEATSQACWYISGWLIQIIPGERPQVTRPQKRVVKFFTVCAYNFKCTYLLNVPKNQKTNRVSYQDYKQRHRSLRVKDNKDR